MSLRTTRIFNRSDRFVEGWYWAIDSADLPRGAVKAIRVQGRDLVAFRTEGGTAVVMDAHCPHMGAHFVEGRVDGEGIRCFFHDWKFDATGKCVDVPCLPKAPAASAKVWPTAEKYGLVWVWTGEEVTRPIPFVPDIGEDDCDAIVAGSFVKKCHPNVMMINAIDEHHFNSVHDLPVALFMEAKKLNDDVMTFSNTTKMPESNVMTRLAGRLYEGPLTYSMCYWFGSTGTVTVGPDAFHFHIMFALRMMDGGQAEGKTVCITKKRHGVAGRAVSKTALALSKVVGDYFAKGDTNVFQTIKFDFKTPTKADHAIIDFIKHVEGQRPVRFGSWDPVTSSAVSVEVLS
ncbi:MAG TPA: aromatic ring-hydroxylating dioxygenase subunit alpha [Labilithrix sp.]|nr:aromatic ring-hydroxylating dioxygenase subunit alpha [Labilithrix sp.]